MFSDQFQFPSFTMFGSFHTILLIMRGNIFILNLDSKFFITFVSVQVTVILG